MNIPEVIETRLNCNATVKYIYKSFLQVRTVPFCTHTVLISFQYPFPHKQIYNWTPTVRLSELILSYSPLIVTFECRCKKLLRISGLGLKLCNDWYYLRTVRQDSVQNSENVVDLLWCSRIVLIYVECCRITCPVNGAMINQCSCHSQDIIMNRLLNLSFDSSLSFTVLLMRWLLNTGHHSTSPSHI